MNRQVGNRRLLKLAEFLKTVPRKQFDFRNWVGDDWKGAKDLSCGTTACALGWATTIPTFRRLGLRLAGEGGYHHVYWPGHGRNLNAASDLFDLTYEEAKLLFYPSDEGDSPSIDATPKQVAKHIERFVKARAEDWP